MTKTPRLLTVLMLTATTAMAQNHPELDWEVLETVHFDVFYHNGLETAALKAAEIAEAAYEPVTDLYRYRPDGKVRIVLKDHDDYANGAAFFYLDMIEIWTTPLDHDFNLRGTSDWLANVITHEFVHIISLGAARKAWQRTPAVYFQHFGYQREPNRPDILIGFPDVLVSYPLPSTVTPMWFAEGVAQYQVESARHDHWDSHRDMVLRTAVLDNGPLSFDEMGVFGKRGFGNEFVYDHGYGLVRFIAHTYGDEALQRLCSAMSGWRAYRIDDAIEEVLEIGADDLYADWKREMRKRYDMKLTELGELHQGVEVTETGFSNTYPVYAPGGGKLAFLSTGKQEYGPHKLVVRDLATGVDEAIVAGVVSRPSWSPDGSKIAYVRKHSVDKYGSRQADVFVYDFDGEDAGLVSDVMWALPGVVTGYDPQPQRVEQLSTGLRALYPTYSPDGAWLAFIQNQGSSNNLGFLSADGAVIVYVTEYDDGTELYTPSWSPDGARLALSVSHGGKRDLVLIDFDLGRLERVAAELRGEHHPTRGDPAIHTDPGIIGNLQPLVISEGTDRDPQWSADGSEILYSSDVTGIFNIYSITVDAREIRPVTNMLGGAFSPTVGVDGTLTFSSYGVDGFRLHTIVPAAEGDSLVPTDNVQSIAFQLHDIDTSQLHDIDTSQLHDIDTSQLHDIDTSHQLGSPRPYGGELLKTMIMPRLMWDEGRFKTGGYAASSDVLQKQNISGGFALAPSNGDRELFALYEHRGWRPTMFLEYYHQKRHTARRDSSDARDAIITGMNFSLNQLSVGLRFGDAAPSARPSVRRDLTLSLTYDRYDASLSWDAFIPRTDGVPGFARRQMKPIGYTYLNGFAFGVRYNYDAVQRRRDRAINPRGGRRIQVRYHRNFNFFLEEFDQNNTSFLKEKYLDLFYNQLTVDWNEYLVLPFRSALDLRFYGGWIDNEKLDDDERIKNFFDYHIGGLQYMKGYTFYSIEGRKAAMTSALVRFPLLSDMRMRLFHVYFDKLYAGVFSSIGKAWDDNFKDPDPFYSRSGFLRDVGVQLRLDSISYYSLPTRVQADLAHGVDEVSDRNPWKFYLTVLFGYL